ncbi:alkaline phosphatase D family protein [Marinobacter shengliensis]|uniref:alkaline phosphatase D family protein n=1 Tax=Marinobacter shengliensis TaxID=1389223 RepID=UPI0035BA5FAA
MILVLRGSCLPAGPGPGSGGNGQPGIEPVGFFEHGVASGDPLDDRVILWTRVTPAVPTETSVPVQVLVSRQPDLSQPQVFVATAEADSDFCVKVDATGLAGDTWYYYAFRCGPNVSPVGRTRTFPAPDQRVRRARFATVSCSNLPYGHFSVYNALARVEERDLDFVLHLGDYLYEYEPGNYDDPTAVPNRVHEPANEILSLSDYRIRHGQYKRDADLQAVHQQYPMICIWDDHEIANDAYMDGAENHDPATEGDWETRKQAAIRAYFEWMPVRDFGADSQRLWRRFRYGDLIDLWMLDTRIEGRDAQASLPFGPERTDPDRKLISDAQMNWLTDGLTSSGSVWKMIGQQVMFGQLNLAELPQPELISEQLPYGTTQQGLNMDQWDGYTASRTRILDAIEQNSVENVVVFTGDIHTSWANEIYRNPASVVGDLFAPEALAVEFVCPSVTSPGFPAGLAELAAVAVRTTNPHVKYAELQTRGFILMDVDRFGAQAEFHYVASIADETRKGELDTGKRKLVKVAAKQPGERYRLMTDNLTPSRPRTTQTSLLAPAATPQHQQELAAVLGAVHSLESVV